MAELRDKSGMTEKEFLSSYSDKKYEKPSVTADILVLGVNSDFSSLRLLLVRRDAHPYLGCWALPGGFIAKNETAYQAAARKLEEETGLKNVYLDQIYTFTKPGRDPRTWVMSIAYMALVSDFQKIVARNNTLDAAWFDLRIGEGEISITSSEQGVNIVYKTEKKTFRNGKIAYENWVAESASQEKLAFDHIEIIIESFLKLKAVFEHSDLSFNMIGEKFTLPDLQALYELVLGKKMYKTNFRAMVAGKIRATGEKRKSLISGKMSSEYVYVGGS